MRVAAIRVGPDLWRLLEAEASLVGVSVSQYVREAGLARASAAAAARGEDTFELLALAAAEVSPSASLQLASNVGAVRGRTVRVQANEVRSEAQALQAQSKQARHRSRELKVGGQPRSDA